jgi:sugar phosphate isomerase/epimerase
MMSTENLSRRNLLAAASASALGAAGLGAANLEAAARANAVAVEAKSIEKPAWQIGCYTRPWDAHEYPVALDAIAEAGFKYVGLMTTKSPTRLVISVKTTPDEAQKVAEEVNKRGLKVISIYGGDIPVKESLEAGIEGMRKLIDNCVAVEASSLLMGGVGDPKLYDAYYKAIAECCDYAAGKNLEITVKPHGGLNATGPQCRKCVEQVNRRNFNIWYDAGNIYYYSNGELDPVKDAATVDGLVTGMCIKDYEHPKNVDVTPGTGVVNFKAVFQRLGKGGFTGGPLVVECLTRRDSLAQTLDEARKTRAFLEALTREL